MSQEIAELQCLQLQREREVNGTKYFCEIPLTQNQQGLIDMRTQ